MSGVGKAAALLVAGVGRALVVILLLLLLAAAASSPRCHVVAPPLLLLLDDLLTCLFSHAMTSGVNDDEDVKD